MVDARLDRERRLTVEALLAPGALSSGLAPNFALSAASFAAMSVGGCMEVVRGVAPEGEGRAVLAAPPSLFSRAAISAAFALAAAMSNVAFNRSEESFVRSYTGSGDRRRRDRLQRLC